MARQFMKLPLLFRPHVEKRGKFAGGSFEASEALHVAKEAVRRIQIHSWRESRLTRAIVVGDLTCRPSDFLESLALSHLIGESGLLARGIELIIAGDVRSTGPADATGPLSSAGLLAWFGCQPPEKATLLLGVHHLERLRIARYPIRLQVAARNVGLAGMRLPTAARRRDLWASWFAKHADAPHPLAVLIYGVVHPDEAKVIRRLLLLGRFSLAAVRRDAHDGRPLLITHAGVTRSVARSLPAPGDPFRIAEALNNLLTQAVSRIRSAWKRGEVTPLDLGALYSPWTDKSMASGLMAERPAIPGLERYSAEHLGLDATDVSRSQRASDYGFIRFNQVVGHTRMDFPSVPLASGEEFPFTNMEFGALEIDSVDACDLVAMHSPISAYSEYKTCFFVTGAKGAARYDSRLGLSVAPQDHHGRWSDAWPAPQSPFRDQHDGLITILSSDYSRDELVIIRRFLTECLDRRSGVEIPWDSTSPEPSLEDLRDWAEVMLGCPGRSPASRLAERWLTEYRNARDGTQVLYPPVSVHAIGDL